jgi:MbtH protein
MNNLLDDEKGSFCALVNGEGQYSLWPHTVNVPDGWNVAATGSRQDCLTYINEHWADMRPESLRRATT